MVLLVSLVLQLCDLATTLVFLQRGVGEANPLVAALIRVSGQPAVAVLLVKAAGCGLVAVCLEKPAHPLAEARQSLLCACA